MLYISSLGEMKSKFPRIRKSLKDLNGKNNSCGTHDMKVSSEKLKRLSFPLTKSHNMKNHMEVVRYEWYLKVPFGFCSRLFSYICR